MKVGRRKWCWKHGRLNCSPYPTIQRIKMSVFSGNQVILASGCTLVLQSYCFFQVFGWLEAIFIKKTLLILSEGKEKNGRERKNKRTGKERKTVIKFIRIISLS